MRTMQIETDILVSGAGLAGMIAALAMAHRGYRVLLCDPAPLTTKPGADTKTDLRSTAFLRPATEFMETIGLWAPLEPHATPLQLMEIVEAAAPGLESVVAYKWDGADLSDEPLGWNLLNAELRKQFLAAIAAEERITTRFGDQVKSALPRTTELTFQLASGARGRAKLHIAADGRESPTRASLGINIREWHYGQRALSFTVRHTEPHYNTSTEVHLHGGPFTLVPLADVDGVPHSAVVWMNSSERTEELLALSDDAFSAAASERSEFVRGPLTLVGERQAWPIISRMANHFSGERTVLIAEAAHVVPPIGAQGLNISLADIATLISLFGDICTDPGARAITEGYHKRRFPDVQRRMLGIAGLNMMSIAGASGTQRMRAMGLDFLHRVKPVRRQIMRLGLAERAFYST